jgi:hypothetical protein
MASVLYDGHAPVICRRHRRWLGIPTTPGQFDLSNTPEIITANRRRDSLFRSQEDQQLPLASDSALLDAAERGSGIGYESAVDTDHAGIESLRNTKCPCEVCGEHIRSQAEWRGIGHGDRLRLGVELDQWRDGAEDFVIEDRVAFADVAENGRRAESAGSGLFLALS